MMIRELDVVRLKDGREVAVLEVEASSDELLVTDQEDVFPISRDEVQAITWVSAEHQSA